MPRHTCVASSAFIGALVLQYVKSEQQPSESESILTRRRTATSSATASLLLASSCSSVKPQSHASSLGSEEELSERTTSSKVRSETVDSILSAVAKKREHFAP